MSNVTGHDIAIAELQQVVADLGVPSSWTMELEIRPGRRTLGFSVSPGGVVQILVPPSASPAEVRDAVVGSMHRLACAVARRSGTPMSAGPKEFVNGEHLKYLGRTFRLRIVTAEKEGVQLAGDYLELTSADGGRSLSQPLIAWYAYQVRTIAERRVQGLSRAVDVATPPIEVRDLGTRWGMRTSDRRIVLHWALAQLPPSLIDLVIAHEVTHLRVSRHSPQFEMELRKLVPDLRERQRLLDEAAGAVWLGAVRSSSWCPP